MTKADLYKRRSKNKQRKSNTFEPGTSAQLDDLMDDDDTKETSLIDTINNLKNRMNKSSIENDVELIKANTHDTPVNESPEPSFMEDLDEIKVKPVEKTYGKNRSKLDDYIYIESSKGLEGTEVAFPKTTRGKRSKEADKSPVPKKRRKIETRQSKKETPNGDSRDTRSLRNRPAERDSVKTRSSGRLKKPVEVKTPKPAEKEKKTRATKESIENDKPAVSTRSRKRRYEEIAKPVLREKGQNGRTSLKNSSEKPPVTRKVAKPKRAVKKPEPTTQDQDVRMTRSRRRRMEISLSLSEVKSVLPALSFESERRVDSVESNRSVKSAIKSQNTKGKGKKAGKGKRNASKAKKPPVRSIRTRANRR